MKRLNLTFKTLTVMIVCALFTMIATSCRDEAVYDENGNVIEGLPATVSLQLDISGLDAQTRALIDDAGANYCQNIWVGVYRVKTGSEDDSNSDGTVDGECIYRNLFDISATSEAIGTKYPLQFTVPSGKARIVAVANVNAVEAVASPDADLSTATALGTLLNGDAAKTWEGFKKITALRSSTDDIYQMTYTLPMSGYYSKDDDDVDKMGDDIPAVALTEGTNDLTGENDGAIHLRRLIAYNQFRIFSGIKNMTVELVSWQVCNNPYYTYVLNNDDNAGDAASGSAYNPSIVSTVFTSGEDKAKGEYESFDFYQFENKRTARSGGIIGTDYYNAREREYKNSDGSNSGYYQSLVSSINSSDKANFASYVILKAKLSYAYSNSDDPTNATPIASGDGTVARTAEATYVIHLGYCEGEDQAEKATDFNCKRNTRYTYNVYIKNVNNIVVEAYEDGDTNSAENQPGMEGTVHDTDVEYLVMDSHYNVFNIAMTNKERSTLQYTITAPYGNTTNYISRSDVVDDKDNFILSSDLKPFYDWIKFRPTKDINTLAKYMDTATGLTDKNLMSLEDFRDVAKHPGNNGSTDADDETEQYYTVFIDEYVYHIGESGDNVTTGCDESSWTNYVNKDDRIVELASISKRSHDTESRYLRGKYAFAQHAIQSYYDTTSSGLSDSGLGVEHSNESYGLNFRWLPSQKSVDYENGRHNLRAAVNYQASVDQGLNAWDNCVSQNEIDKIVGDQNDETLMHNKIDPAEYPVPQLKMTGTISSPWHPMPNVNATYYVNTACMNRNRDLNGDGVMDNNELRWFLPTYNQYVEIMVGLEGLVSPIIKWSDWPKDRYSSLTGYTWRDLYKYNSDDPKSTNSTRGRQNFHFASSDCNYIWADEGFSSGNASPSGSTIYSTKTSDNYGYYPYEIRCVRYLGKNPGATPTSNNSEVETAYQVCSTNPLEIDVLHFNPSCVRPYVKTFLAPNSIESDINRPY